MASLRGASQGRNRSSFRFRGFTLVELLVAVSIVATLSAVALVYGNSYRQSQYNERRIADIGTLKSAADSYFTAKSNYPEPTANRVYYDKNGVYVHAGTGATFYGVSSSATNDLFGADILAEVPTDPDTGAPYGYGKRKDGTAAYDFATFDRNGDTFTAYVRGNYDGSVFPSLIREYAGANFVEDGSATHLPYNPYHRAITGHINSWSGTVAVLGSSGGAKSLTGEIDEGDHVTVSPGGSAVLNLSDGTEVNVGSATTASDLQLATLQNAGANNFFTRVRLSLSSGEVWTKAPKLRDTGTDQSVLEIASGNAVASVRGTIFGMRRNTNSSTVMLAIGTIKITDARGNPIAFNGSSDGMLTKTTKNMQSSNVTVNDPVDGTGNGTGDYSTGTLSTNPNSSNWNPPSQLRGPNALKVYGNLSIPSITISFNGNITGVGIGTWADLYTYGLAPNVPQSITMSGTSTHLGTVLSYFVQQNTTSVNGTNAVKLPLRFCLSDPANPSIGIDCKTVEITVPSQGDFNYDESALPQGWTTDCPTGKSWFPNYGCAPKNLVAVAPFRVSGDLNMYTRSGRKLPVATSYITATDPNGVTYSDNLDGNPTTANQGGAGNNASFRTVNTIHGVALDTNNSGNSSDYISYDLTELGIEPKNFSIEVDVPGSALLRNSSAIQDTTNGTVITPPYYGTGVAFLWQLEGGVGMYLATTAAGGTSNQLKVLQESGLPPSPPQSDYNNISVDVSPTKTYTTYFNRRISNGYKDGVSDGITDILQVAISGTGRFFPLPSKITRLTVGSTNPDAARQGPQLPWVCGRQYPIYSCQWGGSTSPADDEIIGEVRIYDLSKQ